MERKYFTSIIFMSILLINLITVSTQKLALFTKQILKLQTIGLMVIGYSDEQRTQINASPQ